MPEPIVPIRSSTQRFTEIEAFAHDVALFTDGSCAAVVTATAVNFGLLSEKEQDSIIYAYAGLLNSLSFPIQILIRTQHKDVTAYLSMLEAQEQKQKNPKLAAAIRGYRQFVGATVKEKDVLDKKFYIIIPFSYLELGASAKTLFGGAGRRSLPYPKPYIFERALIALSPKIDQIIRLLNRIGLHAKQLTGGQLVRLYYEIYNQGAPPLHQARIEEVIDTHAS